MWTRYFCWANCGRAMGAWVTYWTEAGTCGARPNTRQLVYLDQYRFWKYQLSILRPLGAALIGLRLGSQMPFFQHGTMHYVRVESLDKPSSNVVRLLFNKEASSGHTSHRPTTIRGRT